MYYIEKGLGRSWKPLAVAFAACAVVASFGGGNMNQANTVAVSANADFGVAAWIAGLIAAAFVAVVILGGIKSIAAVASRLAPSMAILYVLGALSILALHVGDIPGAFGEIFTSAFSPRAGLGGSVAGTLSLTLLWGVRRGLFSNEAGQGSAPIAHAAAKTNEPVREGVVAMLGPLIDTLIICTMTGLVIVITGVWDQKERDTVGLADAEVVLVGSKAPAQIEVVSGHQAVVTFKAVDGPVDGARIVLDDKPWTGRLGWDAAAKKLKAPEGVELKLSGEMLKNSSALTAWGFKKGLSPLGDWGNYIVTICVFLFALSTMISWSYYGDRCITYLFGVKWVLLYRLVFVCFVFVGATTALKLVWAFGDLALGLMVVPNLIAVVLLLPKIVDLTRDYFSRMAAQDQVKAKAEHKD